MMTNLLIKTLPATLLASTLLFSACAGRTAKPILTRQANDGSMSCSALRSEILAMEDGIFDLEAEQRKTKNKNVTMGAVGLLLFPPVALGMDLKDAAAEEAAAMRKRQRHLENIARSKNCKP